MRFEYPVCKESIKQFTEILLKNDDSDDAAFRDKVVVFVASRADVILKGVPLYAVR